MKLRKVYNIEVRISEEEFNAQEGKVIDAVEKLAETFGLKTALVETLEADEA